MISRMIARKHEEVEQLQHRLKAEQAKVRALSRELETTRRTLNAVLGRNDVSRYDLKRINSTVERQAIEAALAEFKGNVTASARRLGLSRQSLYTKMRTYGIELSSKRGSCRS